MPQGFFTIEQWKRPKRGVKPQWMVVCHLDADQSLSGAFAHLEALGKPGLYRVVQTQRMIWAELDAGKLRLRRWHARSPASLTRTAQAFERDGGRYPVEKARKIRAKAKRVPPSHSD